MIRNLFYIAIAFSFSSCSELNGNAETSELNDDTFIGETTNLLLEFDSIVLNSSDYKVSNIRKCKDCFVSKGIGTSDYLEVSNGMKILDKMVLVIPDKRKLKITDSKKDSIVINGSDYKNHIVVTIVKNKDIRGVYF